MNDKAIEFEATKFKLTKVFNQLKSSGLNITKYEQVYNQIITNLNNDNKNIPSSIVNSNAGFATDCLTNNYTKAIKALELLYLELAKYEIYVRVASFTTYLKNFINKENKTEEEFDIYRESLIDIINKLIKSNTLDYDVEGNILKKYTK